MIQYYIGYGVFVNGEYSSYPDFDTACDYFDSAVALGQVSEGCVVGWFSLEDWQVIYDHEEVALCELEHPLLPPPISSDPDTELTGLA